MGAVLGRDAGWRSLAKVFFNDEAGQATVEYILILGGSATLSVALTKAIIAGIDSGIQRFGGILEKDLKTGRVGINVWTN